MKYLLKLCSIHYKDEDAASLLGKNINSIIDITRKTIIVCIGTNKVVFDSIGPVIGTLLEEAKSKYTIYGVIGDTLNAKNINKKIKEIRKKHKGANVIAIDASLGDMDNIGRIELYKGPIRPGAGVGKSLRIIGDYSIHCIVTYEKGYGYKELNQDIKLDTVLDIAEVVAVGLLLGQD